MHLELKRDELLSSFAFKFELLRYSKETFAMQHATQVRRLGGARCPPPNAGRRRRLLGRSLHSSTFRLNISAFCGVGGAFRVIQGVCRRS